MNMREFSDEEKIISRKHKRRTARPPDSQMSKRRRDVSKVEASRASPDKRKEVATKCFKCGRKLRLTNNFVCRCGHVFCPVHRFFDQHACQFDIKDITMKRLKEENPQVINKKITEF